MMGRSIACVGAVVLGLVASCAVTTDDSVEAVARTAQVTVCHIPPDHPQNAHTVDMPASAVPAHLAHGDYLGACVAQVCEPNTTAACYDGPDGTNGVGACHSGTQTCAANGGGYGACTGEVTPASEVCGDGIDNDCDGVVDDGCVCAPGSAASCYDGPSGTAGVGACAAGVMICDATGTGYGACTGEVTPASEVCGDGIDSDCDGVLDDGCVCTAGATAACYDGPSGTTNVGVCSAGTMTCTADGSGYGACTGEVTPSAETCGDAVDNDCDGITDDGCVCTAGSTSPCYTGPGWTENVGACSAGTMTCDATGTGYGACTGDVTPVAEVCGDAIDNDCDGSTDEGCVCTPGATAACYAGPPGTDDVGTCHSGSMTCSADGSGYGACVGEILPDAEVCGDGLDNDCDGAVDETCVCAPASTTSCYGGPPGTGGVGACQAGVESCAADGSGYGACVGDVVPTAEVCGDAIDNDCDGLTDEGCIGDRAWDDRDQNGIQDPGESGLAGVGFLLRNASTGGLVAVAVSNGSGAYYFSNVPAGDYYVEVVPPAGFALSPAFAGPANIDSNFDGESMASENFTFSGTSPDYTIDGGLFASIST